MSPTGLWSCNSFFLIGAMGLSRNLSLRPIGYMDSLPVRCVSDWAMVMHTRLWLLEAGPAGAAASSLKNLSNLSIIPITAFCDRTTSSLRVILDSMGR